MAKTEYIIEEPAASLGVLRGKFDKLVDRLKDADESALAQRAALPETERETLCRGAMAQAD